MHLHTPLCGHATGALRDYAGRALQLGLDEIGFADHLPLPHKIDPTLTMSEEDLPRYLAEIDVLRSAHPSLPIRAGIEADYVPGYEGRIEALLERYDFDFVIGSIHFLGDWGFDDPRYLSGYEGRHIGELYREYFETLRQAARSGLFDVLGHPDLIKKFGHVPDDDPGSLYDEVIADAGAAGLVIEINTAGLRQPIEEVYPTLEFLKRCRSAGLAVTVGSDAHKPDDVGRDIDLALGLAREAGFREVVTFVSRKANLVPID